MLNKLKEESGITLIALIVTIIVLIILAGISINLLIGENGVITRAKDVALEQAVGQRKEAVSLAITTEFASKSGDKSALTVEGVLKELQTSQNSNKIYAIKTEGQSETLITATEGNTSLAGASFYFPEEINGSAKTGIIVTVDDNLNVTTRTGEVEDASEKAADITLNNAVVNATVTSWSNGRPIVTATTEAQGVSLKYSIGESTTLKDVPQNGIINDNDIPVNNTGVTVYIFAISGGKQKQGATVTVVDNTAPTGVAVTVTSSTANSITVNVTATETQSGIASYIYYVKKDNGSYQQTTTNPIAISGEGIYKVKAKAVDNAGNESQESAEVTVDKKGPTITAFAVTGTPTQNSITVSVTATDESGLAASGTYTYYKDGVIDGQATTSNTHEYTGLTAGTSYTLSVVVKDANNNTTTSSNETGTTAAAQAAADEYGFFNAQGNQLASWTELTDPNGPYYLNIEQDYDTGEYYDDINVYSVNHGNSGNSGYYIIHNASTLSGGVFSENDIKKVKIPEETTTIGYLAFYNCSELTSVTIPGSVTNISSRAFENCTSLESLTLTYGIEYIGERAFYGCNLDGIEIPGSLEDLGDDAFGREPKDILHYIGGRV